MYSVKTIEGQLNAQGLKIAIVASRFNDFIVQHLVEGAIDYLTRHGASQEDITVVRVPGAYELPIVCKKLAAFSQYSGIIALGAVIRGETYHFEIVSNESAAGIMRVSLDFEIPIANGVLTTNDDEQCEERIDMKGRDCARCAVEMANLAKEFVSAEDFEPEDDEEEDR